MAPIKEQAIDKYPYIQYTGRFDEMSESFSGSTNKRYSSKRGFVRSLTVEGKSEAHSSPNLYDPSKSVSGYLVAGGSVQPGGSVTNERTSDFIPVTAGETYVFQVWVTPAKSASDNLWMAYILYDSDKSAVGQRPSKSAGANTGTPQHASFIIEIPNGISYIRLSARMYDDGRMMLEHGDTESEYQPFPYIESIESVTVGGTTIETDLLSAGSAHDELIVNYDEWTVNRNVGAVDLGTLTWETYGSGENLKFGTTGLTTAKNPSADSVVSNIICAKYAIDTANHVYDRVIDGTIGLGSTGVLYVYDSAAGSDPAAFKTAMNGVMLNYELATPTQDEPESINPIEISSSFEVKTEVDTTFAMVSGAV